MEEKDKGATSGKDGGVMKVGKRPVGQEGCHGHIHKNVCLCTFYVCIYCMRIESCILNDFIVPVSKSPLFLKDSCYFDLNFVGLWKKNLE